MLGLSQINSALIAFKGNPYTMNLHVPDTDESDQMKPGILSSMQNS